MHDVVEDDWLPLQLLGFAETLRVDQLHLLEDRRLARFSRTCGWPKRLATCLLDSQRLRGPRKKGRLGGWLVPRSSSFTSFDMRFSSARIILSSSRDRAVPASSSFSRVPKHMVTQMAGRNRSFRGTDSVQFGPLLRGRGRRFWWNFNGRFGVEATNEAARTAYFEGQVNATESPQLAARNERPAERRNAVGWCGGWAWSIKTELVVLGCETPARTRLGELVCRKGAPFGKGRSG